ncbi:histidine kinase [Halobacteriales archaeon QS_8_65_32]|nr:MAG: histidine kinase [Halobacteriales archaeon QS_8_65_32]
MSTTVPIATIGYAVVFAAAAIACFASLPRARRIDDAGTRRGLVALLVSSGSWAATQVGFVAAPTERFAARAHLLGLLFGFATVFAWLYFASAYTGRSYHREPTYRRAGLGLYLAVAAVKITNPLHHRYFTTEPVAASFPRFAIQQGNLHWIATGLSYVLAGIGIFVILERFAEVDYDTSVLGGLVALTGLPVVFSVVGYTSPRLLGFSYAPLGVAAFAVGVLFVVEERFLAVPLTGDADGAVVLLDDADRIRDYSREARDLFPGLVDAIGDPVDSIAPTVPVSGSEEDVLELDVGGETRYYLATDEGVSLGRADLGRVVAFTDVTTIERQRRELERHNDQLEGFAVWVRHELRNALTIVDGYADWAADAVEKGDDDDAREALGTVSTATDRMARIVADLATVAQYGRTIDGTEPVPFREAVEAAWTGADTGDLTLTVAGTGTIEADRARLRRLLGNAFVFFTHNSGSELSVSLREDGFVLADDGQRPPPEAAERYFDYGDAAPTAAAGMALPNVRTLARVHGWTVTVDPDHGAGTGIVVAGALVEVHDASPPAV